MIRLYIIEDHPVIVSGLKGLFRPSRDEIEITGSATDVEDAIVKADPTAFDIFLLDLWIPNAHPLLNVRKLKEHFNHKPIVIFTSEDSSSWQRKMFEAGVMAYMLKNAGKSEIKLTLEKVMKGQVVFSGSFENENERKSSSVFSGQTFQLTANQKELITLLSSGLTQQQIADAKKTSVSTVEKTLKHVREKCGAKNNAELVRNLLEKGYI
ncbi:MAG: response regulator transcription factor [Bacteroidetes bacterium]|nr:response regulator transcription factor [Bacteroidota bacterium]